MWFDSTAFLTALTPKFYVALTGTSSLISGLILIFEWWYFRKYGTSFIEQVSLTQIGPWLGGGGATNGTSPASEAESSNDCKVLRNPTSLLRGAEYSRLWRAAGRAPLTYYDMNLSAQEHQAWFGGGSSNGATAATAAASCMARAWREREPAARVAAARAALAANPDCAPALLLLAEEDAPTVQEAERVLRRALRCAELAWRSAAAAGGGGAGGGGGEARRAGAVLAHVRRRLAMCARRLGRLRDAARMFRDLARDAPPALHALALHENLIEVLLEQKAYADVQAVLARYEDIALPKSATVCYTAALLRARTACLVSASGGGAAAAAAEAAALESLRRAVEFNPFVPEYLLELRALSLPPEHVLRRGDSEALAYAFWHLAHWRAAEGALGLLGGAWAAWRGAAAASGCGACADRELLPAPRRAARPRAALPAAAAACALLAAAALAAHRWPDAAPADLVRLLAAL